MAKGKLVIMGSGETAPGMTKVHRELLSGLDEVRAVNLDTPYGFQLNVPQMTQKLVDYFKVSLQTDLKPLSFINYEKSSGVERELFRQSVREANYVFAGPGSPSYALAQWKGLDLQEDLLHVLDNGGVVCFSSAAALTLGAFTAPIYEIYKAGANPYWLEGLNLMGLLGINCAVIPHFNNAEGQDYDTSCCYLGLERLGCLEEMIPDGSPILGIDEHTAMTIDFENQTMSITGKGNAYRRLNDEVQTLISGSETFLENEIHYQTPTTKHQGKIKIETATTPLELAALVEKDNENAIMAMSKLVSLANLAQEKQDDFNYLVENIIQLRNRFKIEGNYDEADNLRDVLTESKIKIVDHASGSNWSIR